MPTPGPHMTRAQNYREAERLLAEHEQAVLQVHIGSDLELASVEFASLRHLVAAAQVHATLAACPFEPHPVSSQEQPR